MSLYSFYREASPEPPELSPVLEPYDDGDETSDNFEFDSLELPPEVVKLVTFYHPETSTPDGNHPPLVSQPSFSCQHMAVPVEIWEIIFGFVVPDSRSDAYPSLNSLLNCALTCRGWSLIALPLLYRNTHGYGVLMPQPNTRDRSARYFPISRSIDFYTSDANKRWLQLWRTLLLSCFTASRPTSPSRFSIFTNATLFPYIKYVTYLDARTLVMLLTEIMRSQRTRKDERRSSELKKGAAQDFFSGALGAFEISGETRGERMVVGGPEYNYQCPVGGKEVKIFVGDTALMIMDFLYTHIHHLKGFTIPELGQLRVHSPITMSHPASLLTSLKSLNSLVISSGWMLSVGLGKAIAQIRPSLFDRRQSSPFNLTITDWRFKTHYDPHYRQDENWEADRDDYRYTVRSAADFFNALNSNSITSLDLDFEVRYSSQQQQGDLGEGALAIRQSRSLKALRISHLRCNGEKLSTIFRRMSVAGFVPRALCLEDLYYDGDPTTREPWSFPSASFDELDCLELSRFTGMFDFATAVLQRQVQPTPIPNVARLRPISVLRLRYSEKQLREGGTTFLLHAVPALGYSLLSLYLDDSASLYSRAYQTGRYGVESPLESLTKLRTLVLAGDVSPFLMAGRLRSIIDAIKDTITSIEIRLPPSEITNETLSYFLQCERLESLIISAWVPLGTGEPITPVVAGAPAVLPALTPITPTFDIDGTLPVNTKLTVSGVRDFFSAARRILVPHSIPDDRLVLRELKLSKSFAEKNMDGKLVDKEGWRNIKRWVKKHGTKFSWTDK